MCFHSSDAVTWNHDECELFYLHWLNIFIKTFLVINLNSYLLRGATPANETAANWRCFLVCEANVSIKFSLFLQHLDLTSSPRWGVDHICGTCSQSHRLTLLFPPNEQRHYSNLRHQVSIYFRPLPHETRWERSREMERGSLWHQNILLCVKNHSFKLFQIKAEIFFFNFCVVWH